MQTTPPETLAFVLCPSFHGSTLLSLLLNAHPDVCSLGDTYPIGNLERRCSCGHRFRECPLWRLVASRVEAFGPDHPDLFLPEMPPLVGDPIWNLRLNRILREAALRLGPGVWNVTHTARDRFLDPYLEFSRTVRQQLGSDLLVDGHKSVLKAATIASMLGSGRDVRVLHLVRDPRAFVSSCRKYGWSQTTEETVTIWNDTHGDIRRVFVDRVGVSYLIVRYEDLAVDPAAIMDRVFRFLGFEPPPFDPTAIDPTALHLHGNNMLERWDGTIRLDNSWLDRVPPDDRRRVVDLASDLCETFGYSHG